LPVSFDFGVSWEVYQDESNTFTLSTQLNENANIDRELSFGAEYGMNDSFFLRSGYTYVNENQIYGFNAGVGLNLTNITVNYGYTQVVDYFENLQRIEIQFTF